MTTPIKYLFNEDFEKDEKEEAEAVQRLVHEKIRAGFNEELIDEKQKSYEEGFRAGQEKAQEANEVALRKSNEELQQVIKALNQNIGALTANKEQMRRGFEVRLKEYRDQSVMLAVEAAEKLADILIQQQPMDNLENMFRDILNYIDTDLRVSVYIPEDLQGEAENRIQQVATEQGHQGRVNILSDGDLKAGDWKIEWGAGGISRKREDISAHLEDALQRYITGVPVSIEVQDDEQSSAALVEDSGDSGQGDES